MTMDTRTQPGAEPQIHFDFPARPEQVGRARRRVAGFVEGLGWAEDDVDALALAVGEACNNAVSHGGDARDAATVGISCSLLDPARVQVEIQNRGNGFHPDIPALSHLPDPDLFATCGRGFALMSALVDDVQVLSTGADTIVRLTQTRSH